MGAGRALALLTLLALPLALAGPAASAARQDTEPYGYGMNNLGQLEFLCLACGVSAAYRDTVFFDPRPGETRVNVSIVDAHMLKVGGAWEMRAEGPGAPLAAGTFCGTAEAAIPAGTRWVKVVVTAAEGCGPEVSTQGFVVVKFS